MADAKIQNPIMNSMMDWRIYNTMKILLKM